MPPPSLAREKRALERLRKLCLALPETAEKVAWGEPTWRVRGKMFAMLDNHHHGDGHRDGASGRKQGSPCE